MWAEGVLFCRCHLEMSAWGNLLLFALHQLNGSTVNYTLANQPQPTYIPHSLSNTNSVPWKSSVCLRWKY